MPSHPPLPSGLRVIASAPSAPATRPTILCLPGAGCAPWVFRELAGIDPAWDVVVYDYLSDPRVAATASWSGLVEATAEVVRALGGPVVLVGHSMGGAVALAVLGERPDGVVGGMICATGLTSESHKDRTLPARISEGFGPDEMRQFIRSCTAHASEDDRALLLSHLQGVDVDLFRTLTAGQRRQDLTSAAERIAVPVVLCHGVWDARRSLESATGMHAAIDGSLLYLVDAGHTPMLEAPREVRGLLQSHLRAVS